MAIKAPNEAGLVGSFSGVTEVLVLTVLYTLAVSTVAYLLYKLAGANDAIRDDIVFLAGRVDALQAEMTVSLERVREDIAAIGHDSDQES
jgi:hypothetical protein